MYNNKNNIKININIFKGLMLPPCPAWVDLLRPAHAQGEKFFSLPGKKSSPTPVS